MKRIAHIGATILLLYAIMGTYAHPASAPLPQPAPGAVACVSPERVAERMGTMKPVYDLQGTSLQAWNNNFKALTGATPPASVDRIIIYGNFENDEPQEKALFLTFSGGCLVGATTVPVVVINKILAGNGA